MFGKHQTFHELGVKVGGFLGKQVSGLHRCLNLFHGCGVQENGALAGAVRRLQDRLAGVTDILHKIALGQFPLPKVQYPVQYRHLKDGNIQLAPGLGLVPRPIQPPSCLLSIGQQGQPVQSGQVDSQCRMPRGLLKPHSFQEFLQPFNRNAGTDLGRLN